jgi:hypothetical protein
VIDLDELERVARETAARESKWGGPIFDHEFFALANPTVLLELVAELREARAVVDACIDEDNEGEQAYALAKAYRAKWGK